MDQTTDQPHRGALDDQDIRLAIGAPTNNVHELVRRVERIGVAVDDLGALGARCVRLDQLAGDIDAILDTFPGALRKAASEAPLSMIAGGPAREFADQLDAALAVRRARRTPVSS
jgi:hypothetical protein